jgi:hypothetical protein
MMTYWHDPPSTISAAWLGTPLLVCTAIVEVNGRWRKYCRSITLPGWSKAGVVHVADRPEAGD